MAEENSTPSTGSGSTSSSHSSGHSGGGHSSGGHSSSSGPGGERRGPRPAGGPGGPGGRKFFRRKKVCKFCVEKMDFIDYKRADILSQFVQERGKILPRRMTGVCSRHQRWLGVAIKRARNIALLPFAGSAAGTQQPRAVVAPAAGAPSGSSAGSHGAAPAAAATPAATAPTEVSNA